MIEFGLSQSNIYSNSGVAWPVPCWSPISQNIVLDEPKRKESKYEFIYSRRSVGYQLIIIV